MSNFGKGKVLNSQSRQIVSNVISYFEDNGGSRLQKGLFERVSAATGVSKSSVKRINNERKKLEESGGFFSSPGKKRNREPNIKIDDFDRSVIRRTVHNFYAVKKEVPTLKKLLEELKVSICFSGSREHLRKVLKEIGFQYKTCKSNRKILIEKPEIVRMRRKYLWEIRKGRSNPSTEIFFQGESYVQTMKTVDKCWQSEDTEGVSSACSKGPRYILVHAGNENGFLKNAGLVYKSGIKTGNYYSNMNGEDFEKWLREQLIPDLPEKAVVCLDSAPHHNIQISTCPTSSSPKKEIQDWLTHHNIPFDSKCLKAELLALVKENKLKMQFVVDEILKSHGHSAIRLPPCHPDLNPIQLIWKQVEDAVKIVIMDSLVGQSVVEIVKVAFEQISPQQWKDACDHVKKVEEDYWQRDWLVEEEVDRFIATLGGMSSDEDEEMREDF